MVRRLVRRARHHPCRERQVLLGAGRRRGACLLRRPRRRPLRLPSLLPREAGKNDELMCDEVGEISSDGGSFAAPICASVQYSTWYRKRDGTGECRGGALRSCSVRGERRCPLRVAERARSGRGTRHAVPCPSAARPGLRLRRRGATHHRLGLGVEPVVAVGARSPRRHLAGRLGLERGQFCAAAGADELVGGARAGDARAPLSACDTPPAGRRARWGGAARLAAAATQPRGSSSRAAPARRRRPAPATPRRRATWRAHAVSS